MVLIMSLVMEVYLKEPPAVWGNSECSALPANLDHPSPGDQIEMTRQAHSWGSFSFHNNASAAVGQVIACAPVMQWAWV